MAVHLYQDQEERLMPAKSLKLLKEVRNLQK